MPERHGGTAGGQPLPDTVAAYYEAQVEPARATLLATRERILEVVPDAVEVMKYRMPTFVVGRCEVAGLLVNKRHLGWYPYSGSVLATVPDITERYGGTAGALHLPLDRPAAKAVVRRLVKARLAECAERGR